MILIGVGIVYTVHSNLMADAEYSLNDLLLDRLNNECAISGSLYVALISLWTTAIDKQMDMPQEIMYPVVEAVSQYEKMHIPD